MWFIFYIFNRYKLIYISLLWFFLVLLYVLLLHNKWKSLHCMYIYIHVQCLVISINLSHNISLRWLRITKKQNDIDDWPPVCFSYLLILYVDSFFIIMTLPSLCNITKNEKKNNTKSKYICYSIFRILSRFCHGIV